MIINHPAKPTHPLQALRFIATSLSIRQIRRDRTSTRPSPPSSKRDDRRRAATVSGVESGWQPYPGAHDGEAAFRLPPVEPGRVVGLGAVCDLSPPRADARDQDFEVSEFVTLEDGRRVLLHDGGRGFATGIRSSVRPKRTSGGFDWPLDRIPVAKPRPPGAPPRWRPSSLSLIHI